MSRKTETRRSAPSEYVALVEIACDLCARTTGQSMNGRGETVARDDWANGRYDRDEITVERDRGTSYPEGGSGVITSFDVCPECWETKVVPWFASQGAQTRLEERDW